MLLLLIILVEKTSDNHEERIESLEKLLENQKTTFDYSQTIINPPSKGINREKELENELRHLADRVKGAKNSLDSLLKKRNDGVSTAPTHETIGDDDDEDRESLENQLQAIKTRLSRVEDSNGMLLKSSNFSYFYIAEIKQAMDRKKDENGNDISIHSEYDQEIRELKQRIKEIEDKLKELRGKHSPKHVSSKKMPMDNTNIIFNLSERLEALENSHENALDTITDHTERIENLEKDNNVNKEKISLNKQDIGEIKDTLPDKVDCDTFDQEINYLKELINQLLSDKKIDVSQIPKPAATGGMSTKDTNKLKELSAKIPELEKMISDILERLSRAEHSIDNHDKSIKEHDKSIEEIWAELAKKANTADLKALFDRLNQLESDLKSLYEHINNSSKGAPTPMPTLGGNDSDKRLTALEKKLEELRSLLNNSLRDLDKTIDALNSEMKGVKRDLESQKSDILKFMKKVNDLELKIEALMKKGSAQAQPATINATLDNDKIEDLKKALNELRNDYRSFKNEILNQFNQIDKELDRKADKEDLENLKNLLKNRLDELEKALNKTKNDLKRALRILNDKVSAFLFKRFRLRMYQRLAKEKTEMTPCLLKNLFKDGAVHHVIRMLSICKVYQQNITIGRSYLNLKKEFLW